MAPMSRSINTPPLAIDGPGVGDEDGVGDAARTVGAGAMGVLGAAVGAGAAGVTAALRAADVEDGSEAGVHAADARVTSARATEQTPRLLK